MKMTTFCALAALAIAGAFVITGQQGARATSDPVLAPIDKMKLQALSGDKEAARELARIYGKIDFASSKHWTLIGAENGDPIAQYNYALLSFEKGDRFEKERALFWLRKAAATKDSDAIDLLRKYEGQLKKARSS